MDSNEEVRKMYPSPAVLSNKKHLAPEGLITRDNMKNLLPEGLIARNNKRKQTYPGIVVSDNTKYLIKVFVIDRGDTKQ